MSDFVSFCLLLLRFTLQQSWVKRYAVSTCSAILYAKPSHINKANTHPLYLLIWLVLRIASQFVIKIAVHRSRSIPATIKFLIRFKPSHKPKQTKSKPCCLLHVDVATLPDFVALSIYMCSTPFRTIFWLKRQSSHSSIFVLPFPTPLSKTKILTVTATKSWPVGWQLIIFFIIT